MEVLLSIITAILGCSTLMGWLFYRKANKRLKNAEAAQAEATANNQQWDRYEKQIDHAHSTINVLLEQTKYDAQRIAEQNKELDGKTDRIREVEDRLVVTERENTRLAEENGELKKELEKVRCHVKKCKSRQPPNQDTLAAIAEEKFNKQS